MYEPLLARLGERFAALVAGPALADRDCGPLIRASQLERVRRFLAQAAQEGIRTVARHPWGYGLGNAGVSASRTGVDVKAGESTYTELGVDAGLLGLAAFVGWLGALFVVLRARSPWLAASIAAVAVLGLQTDVIGIHWLSVVVFALAGAALRAARGDPPPEDAL